MKYWEIIANRLSASGWSWGCVSVLNARGENTFVLDARRGDGKRYVVRSDQKLSAFLELEKVMLQQSKESAFLLGVHCGAHVSMRLIESGWTDLEKLEAEVVRRVKGEEI